MIVNVWLHVTPPFGCQFTFSMKESGGVSNQASRSSKRRAARFWLNCQPSARESEDANNAQHHPRKLWLVRRFAQVKQPAATDITNSAANRQTQTAKPPIAAASSCVRQRSTKVSRAGSAMIDRYKNRQIRVKSCCRPLTMPTGHHA